MSEAPAMDPLTPLLVRASNARMRRVTGSTIVLALAMGACATALNDFGIDGSVGVGSEGGLDGPPVVVGDTGTKSNDAGLHDATQPPMEASSAKDVGSPIDTSPGMDVVTLPEASSDVGTGTPDTGVDAGGNSIPTTCDEANHNIGCCGPNGKNYYCQSATSTGSPTVATCASGKVCTWDTSLGYYKCLTGTVGKAGPAGSPIACQ